MAPHISAGPRLQLSGDDGRASPAHGHDRGERSRGRSGRCGGRSSGRFPALPVVGSAVAGSAIARPAVTRHGDPGRQNRGRVHGAVVAEPIPELRHQ